MRLICPNCGAQYEVSDDVIPVSGRDVQCSNCGHTWFEEPGASVLAETAEADLVGRTVRPRPAPKPMARPPEPVLADDEPATFADVPEVEPAPRPAARVPQRTISPQIADILREEAAREEAARRAEAQAGLEIQGELGLRDTSAQDLARAEAARREMLARSAAVEAAQRPPQAEPVVDAAAAAVTSAMAAAAAMPDPVATVAAPPSTPAPQVARRDLLPDIEEINSSLRSAAERGPEVTAEALADTTAKNRGFRYGFSLILLIAAVLAMVYVYTPRIIVMVPATASVLEPYADAVDSGRLWLDLELQDLLKLIAPEETAAPEATPEPLPEPVPEPAPDEVQIP